MTHYMKGAQKTKAEAIFSSSYPLIYALGVLHFALRKTEKEKKSRDVFLYFLYYFGEPECAMKLFTLRKKGGKKGEKTKKRVYSFGISFEDFYFLRIFKKYVFFLLLGTLYIFRTVPPHSIKDLQNFLGEASCSA